MKYDYLKLVEIIKEARMMKGISTRELALNIGVSQSEISKFENGLKANFYLIPFLKLCEELDLDYVALLEYAEFVEADYNKLFRVKITNVEENIFYFRARNKKEAALNASNFAVLNHLIKFDPNKKCQVEVEEVKEDNDEYLEQNSIQKEDNSSCENCEYYCPNCGMCCYEE